MHDGSFSTLAEMIEYYDSGAQENPSLDPELRPLHLTPAEKRDILGFLGALEGRIQN